MADAREVAELHHSIAALTANLREEQRTTASFVHGYKLWAGLTYAALVWEHFFSLATSGEWAAFAGALLADALGAALWPIYWPARAYIGCA